MGLCVPLLSSSVLREEPLIDVIVPPVSGVFDRAAIAFSIMGDAIEKHIDDSIAEVADKLSRTGAFFRPAIQGLPGTPGPKTIYLYEYITKNSIGSSRLVGNLRDKIAPHIYSIERLGTRLPFAWNSSSVLLAKPPVIVLCSSAVFAVLAGSTHKATLFTIPWRVRITSA